MTTSTGNPNLKAILFLRVQSLHEELRTLCQKP